MLMVFRLRSVALYTKYLIILLQTNFSQLFIDWKNFIYRIYIITNRELHVNTRILPGVEVNQLDIGHNTMTDVRFRIDNFYLLLCLLERRN